MCITKISTIRTRCGQYNFTSFQRKTIPAKPVISWVIPMPRIMDVSTTTYSKGDNIAGD
jgi:hypothetical protein